MDPIPLTRRTRIVCISDTHNTFPKLPPGDVLIHAGDLTNQGTFSELEKTIDWLEKAPFECKIVIAGNHDITLDSAFYEQYGGQFHNQKPQNTDRCMKLLTQSTSITYLDHQYKTIRLSKPEGPGTEFKVFGSPYSPSNGLWAFGYTPEDAVALWEQIPSDSDIVVTHTPPKHHVDEKPGGDLVGCEGLRQALWRARPRLAVCGHVHEARGVENVLWDLTLPNTSFRERETFYWKDPTTGTKKQFRVDLASSYQSFLPKKEVLGDAIENPQVASRQLGQQSVISTRNTTSHLESNGLNTQLTSTLPTQVPFPVVETTERHRPMPTLVSATSLVARKISGGTGTDPFRDREGREETCIINAAILGSSWPHTAGKRFNKPIVVDIDLPAAS